MLAEGSGLLGLSLGIGDLVSGGWRLFFAHGV